jgi:hypothetical protein
VPLSLTNRCRKASTCGLPHREKKDQERGKEVTIMAVLAKGGKGDGGIADESKKSVCFL